MTYYIGQAFRGVGGFVYIIDLSDPSNPKQLPPWQYPGGRQATWTGIQCGRLHSWCSRRHAVLRGATRVIR